MLLYQSARQSERAIDTEGYFATAVITAVVWDAGNVRAELVLSALVPLSHPRQIWVDGGFQDEALRTQAGGFDGWHAADDVREITSRQYQELAGDDDIQPPFRMDSELDLFVPRFESHPRQIRDERLRRLVYLAYGGRCAISGLSLLNPDGSCGLVAAHIIPHAIEPRSSVKDAILLAPNCHSRFDGGGIIIHDDYSWTARVEDNETLSIRDRWLHLPLLKSEQPDRQLLARKRALVARSVNGSWNGSCG